MNDIDDDSGFRRFLNEDDRIKPIDIAGGAPAAEKRQASTPPAAGADPLKPQPPAPERRPQTHMAAAPDATAANDITFIGKGEYLDLIEKVPILKRIMVGAGWDSKIIEGNRVDVDLSMFLLDKHNMTRVDEDFVFYNNTQGCAGAVQHMVDSRSGAGDGDDENIFIDLNGVPFDIAKIVFVFSVYDPEAKGHHLGMTSRMFLRIVNKDDNKEIVRYQIADEDKKGGNAVIAAVLIREGPRWILEAGAQISHGGLAKIASEYGIIVKELQSTGEEKLGDTGVLPKD